jgi:hypothetical protein
VAVVVGEVEPGAGVRALAPDDHASAFAQDTPATRHDSPGFHVTFASKALINEFERRYVRPEAGDASAAGRN